MIKYFLPDLIRMKFKIYLILFLIAVSACKKGNSLTPKPETNLADVYAAGNIVATNGKSVAAYWKNGVVTKLTDSSSHAFAKSILVNGSDVYVAGYEMVNNIQNATYWKNGVKNVLSSQPSEAYSIAMNSEGVYVAGYAIDPDPYVYMVTTYWKNGIPMGLPGKTPNFTPRRVVAIGNDIYVSGAIADPKDGHFTATYWKNGSLIKPADTSSTTFSTAIAVNGTDVHLSGFTMAQNGKDVATYWKNGVSSMLADSSANSLANEIALAGNDVYIVGTSVYNALNVATYWKNGVQQQLTDVASNSQGHAIAVNGSDIYIAGTNAFGAVYWKNAKAVQLAKSGNAYGMVVIPH